MAITKVIFYKYIFDIRSITYCLDIASILYRVKVLRDIKSTTWYQYIEIYGRLLISKLKFNKLLLNNLLSPNI